MDTRKYLDAVRRKIGAESNAEVARALGLSRAAMTKYYNGERIIDDYTAARVAEVLGIDPLTVIAQANAEREKDGEKRQFWERLAHAVVVVLTCGSLFFSGADIAQADQGVTSATPMQYKLSRFRTARNARRSRLAGPRPGCRDSRCGIAPALRVRASINAIRSNRHGVYRRVRLRATPAS